MKKGLSRKFLKFNEYSLAKNNKNGEVKLKGYFMFNSSKG